MKEQVDVAHGTCSLGTTMIAASEHGIVAILLAEGRDLLWTDLQLRFPQASLIDEGRRAQFHLQDVLRFIDSPRVNLSFPLDPRGTPFQRRVWQALRGVSAGTTVSYAELARRIGAPGSSRAVAGACAANPIAVVIPCHRAIRSNGGLSGYRWGIERKQALLARERQTAQSPQLPFPAAATSIPPGTGY